MTRRPTNRAILELIAQLPDSVKSFELANDGTVRVTMRDKLVQPPKPPHVAHRVERKSSDIVSLTQMPPEMAWGDAEQKQ